MGLTERDNPPPPPRGHQRDPAGPERRAGSGLIVDEPGHWVWPLQCGADIQVEWTGGGGTAGNDVSGGRISTELYTPAYSRNLIT